MSARPQLSEFVERARIRAAGGQETIDQVAQIWKWLVADDPETRARGKAALTEFGKHHSQATWNNATEILLDREYNGSPVTFERRSRK